MKRSQEENAICLAIGRAIKRIRKKKKMTQAQLAELSGLTQAGISQIEKKRGVHRPTTLAKIAQAFNMRMWQIIRLAEEEELGE